MERLIPHLRPGMPGASGGLSYLKGMEVVMANLNKQIEGIKNRSVKGLIMSAAHIREQTEHKLPLTPVDYGNLRASWFVVTADRVVPTKGPKTFKGPDANEISSQKEGAIMEGQGEMGRISTKDKKFLMMGYGANYAGFVHEFIPEMMVNFKRPGSDAKWLQAHLYESTNKILQIIKENAQIKG